jgi:hypothetical protein
LISALLFQEPPRRTLAMPPPFPIPSAAALRRRCVDEKSKSAFWKKFADRFAVELARPVG